jgi:hypothetical protein
MRRDAAPAAFSQAIGPTLALSNVSFNLAGRRLIDDFGCTVLARRQSFGDRGTSHPNLELGFLTMNYYVQPSEVSGAVLASFMERRRPASRGR